MGILSVILTAVEVLSSALLLCVILMQRSKGQGVVAFGGGMGETLFGSQMGNVLTKATVVLAFVFLVNTTLLVAVNTQRGGRSVTDTMDAPPAPVMPMDTIPGGQPGTPGDGPVDMPPVDGGDFGSGDPLSTE